MLIVPFLFGIGVANRSQVDYFAKTTPVLGFGRWEGGGEEGRFFRVARLAAPVWQGPSTSKLAPPAGDSHRACSGLEAPCGSCVIRHNGTM